MSDWIKVFNSLRSHPKIVRAGDRAAWLYVCGLCYSNEHLTDGFLAGDMLAVIAPGVKQAEKLAPLLASAGLWHAVDDGWQIHDYADVQRTADQIKESRNWDVGRKALMRNKPLIRAIRERDQDKCRYCAIDVDWSDRRSPTGATYDHVLPRQDHTFENVVVACRGCNMKKGPRTPEQAGMALLPEPVLIRGSNPGIRTVQDRVEESREEKNNPPAPTGGAVVKFDRKPVPTDRLALAERVLADLNEQAGTEYGAYTGDNKPSENLKRIIGALTRRPDLDFEWAQRATNHQLHRTDRFWDGPPHAGHVFGEGVLDQLLEATKTTVPTVDRQERFRSLQGRIA